MTHYGFTWKGVTTLRGRTGVEVFDPLSHTGCTNLVTAHHKSQKSSLLDFSAFDLWPLLDLLPYVFGLMNAFFLPPRQLLVSAHFSMVWKSTSETCLKRVIHHNGRLVIIILSQVYVNVCMVMHLKGLFLKCFQVLMGSSNNQDTLRLQLLCSKCFNAWCFWIHIFVKCGEFKWCWTCQVYTELIGIRSIQHLVHRF